MEIFEGVFCYLEALQVFFLVGGRRGEVLGFSKIWGLLGGILRAPMNGCVLVVFALLEDGEVESEHFVWPHQLQKKVMIIISNLFYKQFYYPYQ